MTETSSTQVDRGSPWLRGAIIVLALTTAIIHFTLYTGQPSDVVFVLNGLGWLILLGALFLPLPFLASRRHIVHLIFMGYAAVTIVAWLAIGDKSWWLGYLATIIEIVLIVLAYLDDRRS
jgi:hypothetical protein